MNRTCEFDLHLIELHTAYREAYEAFGDAAIAYDDAHTEALHRADERGEPTPKNTGNSQQDHIDALPFDEAWGILELRNVYDAANARYDELLREISRTPACGVNGLLIKLEMWNGMQTVEHAERLALDDFQYDEHRILIAVLRDARKLGGFMVEPYNHKLEARK